LADSLLADAFSLVALIHSGQRPSPKVLDGVTGSIGFMKIFSTGSLVAVLAAILPFVAGCGDSGSAVSQKSSHGHDHAHGPPHGGTPVLIEEHKIHLELVRDPSAGVMQAYVLDDHLEKYIAVPETNFTLTANIAGRTEQLEFQRAPNPSDGKLPSASSVFEGRAEWVKSAASFDGLFPAITLNGQTFTNINFPFPKGTQHTH
jgi:hypothetical protein